MKLQKINRGTDGRYRWSCPIDKEYEQKTFRLVFAVCGGCCLVLLVMSLFLMDRQTFFVMLLSSFGVMAVAGGVCFLFNRSAGHRRQRYVMGEDYILFRVGWRTDTTFPFKSIRKADIFSSRNMIELYQVIGSGPVFVPAEDFSAVRDYILQRLPEDAEVTYK